MIQTVGTVPSGRLIAETDDPFLPDHREGWFNMAADDFIAENPLQEGMIATLRFYRWEPPAVSFGCHQIEPDQPVEDAVDKIACRELGWDIVRRPTGGRTLLHLDDISYSIVVPTEGDHFRRLHWLYDRVAVVLVETFRRLGIEADHSGNVRSRSDGNIRFGKRLCLDSRVRGEVMIAGRKIAGAAQRVYRANILQHGSILMRGDTGAILQVTPISVSKRHQAAEHLRRKACSLEFVMGRSVSDREFIELLTKSFEDIFQVKFVPDGWRSDEIDRISFRRRLFDLP